MRPSSAPTVVLVSHPGVWGKFREEHSRSFLNQEKLDQSLRVCDVETAVPGEQLLQMHGLGSRVYIGLEA